MNVTAILMMSLTMGIVSAFCGYLFWKIMKTPPRSEREPQEPSVTQ
jgi:hypothetical protein